MLVQSTAYLTKRNGLYCITSQDYSQMMFTRTFTAGSFSPIFNAQNTTPYQAVTFIGVNGQWGSQFPDLRDADGSHPNQCTLATVPVDEVRLTIAGAVDDGFAVSRDVQQFDVPEEADGTIIDVTNESMTLFPVTGTWEVGGRVMTTLRDFNQIVDAIDDENNLTTFTVTADQLLPGVEYSARVQYRSESNVTSRQSEWYSFTTAV